MKRVLTIAGLLAIAAPGFAADSPKQVTFSKDVAPIFQKKCQECHQPNSIAPMSLITYQEARPWARSIKERVATRQMPPWHIDKTVGVQHFKNDMSLSDEQIDTIVRWIDAGAPAGDPKDAPAPVNCWYRVRSSTVMTWPLLACPDANAIGVCCCSPRVTVRPDEPLVVVSQTFTDSLAALAG